MDITEMDKAMVLAALFNRAGTHGNAALTAMLSPGKMSIEEARRLLDSGQTYFDYVRGRVMKVDLSSNHVDLRLYDRDNGQGAGEEAILEMATRPNET